MDWFLYDNGLRHEQRGFLYWENWVPPPLAKKLLTLPLGKISPVDSPHEIFIPLTKGSSPQPTKFNVSIENIFFKVVSWHQKCIDL